MRGDNSDLPRELRPEHPMFRLGYAKPLGRREFTRVSPASREQQGETETAVAEEVPVALQYNGRPHVVMMATPADLEDFATGFTISEQVVRDRAEILNVKVVAHARGIEVEVRISDAAAQTLEARSRNLIGRTGCGLCGVEMIEDALRDVPPVTADTTFDATALMRAESALAGSQPWNSETGAMHAAAWADTQGVLRIVREDVGRHNALDKVLGALARQGMDASSGFVVVTSRASYELVQKIAVAGIPLIAAVSRPTGLAIRLAQSGGITLVGLLRNGTANVYANPQRLTATDVGSTR